MPRRLSLAVLAAPLLLATPAVAQDAYTTRIEPTPFYGATVTLESGVRVFRALPSTRQVIVNPGGQTPLALGYNDTRVTEHSYSTNYNYNYDRGGNRNVYGGAFIGNRDGFPRRFDRQPSRGHDIGPRR